MNRIALFNMAFGFFILCIAAASGAFIGLDISRAIIHQQEQLNSWGFIINRSAHGHTNLFGILHIILGLTLPYSGFSNKIKTLQTIGITLGTVAMSLGMILQSFRGPTEEVDILGIIIGLFLSAALCALASHSFALFTRFYRA